MMADTSSTVTVCCSFCLKPSTEVTKLVAGHGVYICNECVALCSEIIQAELSRPAAPGPTASGPAAAAQAAAAQAAAAQAAAGQAAAGSAVADPAASPPPVADSPPRVAPWEQQTSLDDILAALPRVAAAGQQAQQYLTHWVRQARSLGATWAQIGAALDMTRQSAWERFSGEE